MKFKSFNPNKSSLHSCIIHVKYNPFIHIQLVEARRFLLLNCSLAKHLLLFIKLSLHTTPMRYSHSNGFLFRTGFFFFFFFDCNTTVFRNSIQSNPRLRFYIQIALSL